MNRMLGLLVAFAAMIAANAFAGERTDSFVELDKTDTIIEFEAAFPNCAGTHKFRVQDGAMNLLSIEGHSTVRFIVKQNAHDDIKLHMVTDKEYTLKGVKTEGLLINAGVNLLSSPLPMELKKAGIDRFTFRSAWKAMDAELLAKPNAKSGSTPTPTVSMACCTFKACGAAVGRFCSSGSGCGGDDCGLCCVSGTPAPH